MAVRKEQKNLMNQYLITTTNNENILLHQETCHIIQRLWKTPIITCCFFKYAEEAGANKFNVYTLNGEGEFVCKSSFVCDDYDLVINSNKLLFKDGFLLGVQELKDKTGIPMRLVKFKLKPAK